MAGLQHTSIERRNLLRLAAATLLPLGVPALAATARTQRRSALVIGNGAYKSAPLKNPVGDAQAVAASLKDLGYEVTLRQNTTLFELIEALRDFSLRSVKSDVRLLFYAGHGIQARGRNYLLPVDVEPQDEDEIAAKAADVGEFIDRLGANKQGLNIVVLDACRVNPFAGGVIVGPDGRRLKFRGLTPTGLARVDAPVGTLVAFSTAPNGVALDGPVGAHSIYAKHLLQHIQTPGLPIEQLFKRVRIGVAEETQRVQVPWESSSLTSDFCFKTGAQGQCG
ncbi:caspase family protein [uncultured Piscinibacter sp.]|uniref:caspase family protein n=1 Tax=uncultured Piscinibacter sp. TaxID=1131835 RepID=UPI00262469FB|nr:caspase family protein [uncultured Piscinibacter sp.]